LLHIDWQQPWFAPWANNGKEVLQAWLEQGALPPALNQTRQAIQAHSAVSHSNLASQDLSSQKAMLVEQSGAKREWEFVAHDALPPGAAYEAFIHAHQQIPTRNNAHDFFNGLCWLRFPKTKRRMNQLQAQAIEQNGIQAQRGPLRDAITLMDENAVLLLAPETVWQALQSKDWPSLFVTHRSNWQSCQLLIFGHALLEKLLAPYKGITGHVLCLPLPDQLISNAVTDEWLSNQVSADFLRTKPFTPLPMLGVPGWWPDNENPEFYADKNVFRD
jgi:hypothetical protein